jgi:hypothetical protein
MIFVPIARQLTAAGEKHQVVGPVPLLNDVESLAVRHFGRIVQILTELDADDRLTADQKPKLPNVASRDRRPESI